MAARYAPFINVMYYVYDVFHSFEDLIYTYRIFREHQGHFRIQTSEGVPQRTFKTLKDLIYTFEKPNQGLITNLRYPVKKPKDLRRSQRCKSEMDSIYDGEKLCLCGFIQDDSIDRFVVKTC
ncbi:SH2 domain-containing protein 1B-like protein [Turdus rufiventris]|nr:SH2 domain-containing protein 1B-like protein [Turdus rufiventris]